MEWISIWKPYEGHIGQSDMTCELAREILGPGPVIGLSVESW